MYGIGLLKGLRSTFKHWMAEKYTEQYPEERPDLPPASQGFFTYEYDKCIACRLCERACPNQVIKIATEKNENNKNVVTGYEMELSYCLYCGLCIEACPTAALLNANNFELASYHRSSLNIDFMSEGPQSWNDAFDAVQKRYWDKKRPGGPLVAMPKAEKPAAAPVKPAEKPPAAEVGKAPEPVLAVSAKGDE